MLLFTVETSIGPENGMDRRGCMLKPSSVLMTSRSSQSDGRTLQSGLGRSTRSPVCWAWSSTVKRLLGYGLPAVEEKSKRTLTPPADASPGRKTSTVTAMRRLAFMGTPFGGEAQAFGIHGQYLAIAPPSTRRSKPVIISASSEARKTAALA